MSIRMFLFLFISFWPIEYAFCQQHQLTDKQYFDNDFTDVIQPTPTINYWIDNNHFVWTKNNKSYSVDIHTAKESTYSPVNPPLNKPLNIVHLKNNNLYLEQAGDEQQLTFDNEKESNPTISPDGNMVAYTKNNDLYFIHLSNKREMRLTTDGSDVILNGYASWVYMEEILGRASNYRSFWWSPDSRYLVFFRSDDSNVPVFSITDANIREGYVENIHYPKVGDPNPTVRIGIVDIQTHKLIWADFNEKDDQYFGEVVWKPNGHLLVPWMNRKQNELNVFEINPESGNKKLFYKETSNTWIDLKKDNRLTFSNNGNECLLLSNKDGWESLFLLDKSGNIKNRITPDNLHVSKILVFDEDKRIVLFTGRTKENSTRIQLFSIGLDGRQLHTLTDTRYHHTNINISPNGSTFITTFENHSTPSKIAIVKKGEKPVEIFNSLISEKNNLPLAQTTIFRIKSRDEQFDLPVRVLWPINMVRGEKYPVMLSIYGGPKRNDVMDDYILNGEQQWYAREGMIQVVADHRGSSHFGREGNDQLYHQLGKWELADYTDVINWLIANGQANPSKIAIKGFSYGGYLSAYALTYGAETFTHGLAGGSVIDWKLYDSHYTERYMGTERDNFEGYRQSSVLTHTSNYKGMLQIAHGVIDENVHLQNSLQLVSDLQEKRKDFEMMFYGESRHGIRGNKGFHFQNLKNEFIYRYLLEKPLEQKLRK